MNTFKITLLSKNFRSGNSPKRHENKRREKNEKKRTRMLENRNSNVKIHWVGKPKEKINSTGRG